MLGFRDPRSMKDALERSVPNELFDVYETVMDTINQNSEDSHLARKILSWIFHAKRALNIGELREAIAIRENDNGLDEEDMISAEDIIDVCGSLVLEDKESGEVRFCHETVQEFLEARYSFGLLPETEIASTCLRIFLFDIFEAGPASNAYLLRKRMEQHPFLVYAVEHWADHLISAGSEADNHNVLMLTELIECPGKVDSIAQVEIAGNEGCDPLDFVVGRSLLHLCAENGLEKLSHRVINSFNDEVVPSSNMRS